MLEDMGLTAEALICERHVGAGISADEICSRRLPLPNRNMLPVTIEEQIICYADKFFSKSKNRRDSANRNVFLTRALEPLFVNFLICAALSDDRDPGGVRPSGCRSARRNRADAVGTHGLIEG
jgi:hypothetical protein